MMDRDFLSLFRTPKPILGMLHLKGNSDTDIFERLKREVDIYINEGLSALIIENYFGTFHNMEQALEYVQGLNLNIPYGTNCLNFDIIGFDLAHKYKANFVQLDSVVGHVRPRDEETMEFFLNFYREKYQIMVLGGVRFKYQPVLSEHTVQEDLHTAMNRCEAICVTGDATGHETSLDKIQLFKDVLGTFPLIVGAGMTPDNMRKQLSIADGAIIGSYFKDTYKDEGEVSKEHVRYVVETVEKIRQEGL